MIMNDNEISLYHLDYLLFLLSWDDMPINVQITLNIKIIYIIYYSKEANIGISQEMVRAARQSCKEELNSCILSKTAVE